MDQKSSSSHHSHNPPVSGNCKDCKKPILGQGACCGCSATHDHRLLQKFGDKLPEKMKTLLHPDHLLQRMPSSSDPQLSCSFCFQPFSSYCYRCLSCPFAIHFTCAVPPCIYSGQEHQLLNLRKLTSVRLVHIVCNACGVFQREGSDDEEENSPCLCTMCRRIIHKKCLDLKPTINIRQHPHPITHTFSYLGDFSNTCGICGEGFESRCGGYLCKVCDEFVAHTDCTKEFIVESHVLDLITASLDDTKLADHEEKDVEVADEEIINHWSHPHELVLIDIQDGEGGEQYCDGCKLPIFSPFYGCKECNFFLDKKCITLPQQIKNPNHPHPLTLLANAKQNSFGVSDVFICDACGQYSQGFVYCCFECKLSIDVRCIDIIVKGETQHEGDKQHPLFLVAGGEKENQNSGSTPVQDATSIAIRFVCSGSIRTSNLEAPRTLAAILTHSPWLKSLRAILNVAFVTFTVLTLVTCPSSVTILGANFMSTFPVYCKQNKMEMIIPRCERTEDAQCSLGLDPVCQGN
ncbi:hypothetical protein Tsubulata_037029 [Turnera subulata]|uniref:DC1 domain-containing protein n=1 Tax=Turnera subulata TaxID=218843 RepID=A0A9Q0GJQ4_9ROSI|nr:hypothetical protein Tsubulata_037029 [Turnera subulata]